MEISTKPVDNAASENCGNRRASLKDVRKFFIYSDVLDYEIVARSKAMLLFVLPMNGKHGVEQLSLGNPNEYISIPCSSIPRSTMSQCTPTWEEMIGCTLSRLQFRGKML